MKVLFFSLFVGLSLPAVAQEVSVTLGASTSGFPVNQFLLQSNHPVHDSYRIQFTGSSVTFLDSEEVISTFTGYAVSPNNRFWAFINDHSDKYIITVAEAGGVIVNTIATDIPVDYDDPSMKVFVMDNGFVALRSDIAFFSVYDVNGKKIRNIRAVHGSSDGEGIAQAVFSRDGSALYLYNPEVYQGNNIGSRVLRFRAHSDPIVIFSSGDSTIESVSVFPDGTRILIHTISNSGNHAAVLVNASGREIRRIEFDHEPVELTVSDDARFLTSRASARVVVYNLNNGERVGATSLRESTISANYLPADNSIVVLTGNFRNNQISNGTVHVVNISQRSINRADVPQNLGWYGVNPLRIYPLRTGVYVISGASQNVVVRS